MSVKQHFAAGLSAETSFCGDACGLSAPGYLNESGKCFVYVGGMSRRSKRKTRTRDGEDGQTLDASSPPDDADAVYLL